MNAVFYFRGKVKKGMNRGKDLGFPTANIALHKKVPEGIYASTVRIDGVEHIAATFVGKAITFSEVEYKAESYILDYNKSIYGKWMSVRLYKKLRGNMKFDSVQKLVQQMSLDILATRNFFSGKI